MQTKGKAEHIRKLPEIVYDEVLSEQQTETEDSSTKGIHAGDVYQYFDFKALRASVELPEKSRRRANQIKKDRNLKILEASDGYVGALGDAPACAFRFRGQENLYRRKSPVDIDLLLSKDKVLRAECSCHECYEARYYWSRKSNCGFIAAALDMAIDYLKEHSRLDATDKLAVKVIHNFAEKRRSQIISENRRQESSVVLEPRIVLKDEEIGLSFKVGDDKLFVVKDLYHFAYLVKNSSTEIYGSSKVINHGIQNFTPFSRKGVKFILDCVAEEERMFQVIEEKTWQRINKKVARLDLYGWRIDRLFELIGEKGISYEDRDHKRKLMLQCTERNPKIKLRICAVQEKGVFQGVQVFMDAPRMYVGTGRVYYIDGERGELCRTKDDFYEKMEPFLTRLDDDEGMYFMVGRRNLPDFYYSVLPEIEDYADIVEERPEIIEQYLLPETKFSFYLDADDDDVQCRVMAEYGSRKCSCLDQYRRDVKPEAYRVPVKEQEMLYLLQQMFPSVDLDGDCLSCGGDEEKIYDVVTQGVETLASHGNVYCTTRFRNVNTRKKTSLNVGVSVSGGMLELELLTQDMTQEELLELLKNYKKHSRYYRFRSGEFIELEDSSLQMLFEMMETMHMTPKEFVKGKMHLPLYRTLYLDKMLEEHSEVYNTRDQQFKQIIKNMKSVSEADYEVPAKLDKVMRNYQKNGFRWVKTLEQCGFGGILADDMGLGKTLQMISVILSAKEKGINNTSLVVCPASLVYNWTEEFEKFAPQLKVQAVAGKAEERREMLLETGDADVLVTSYDILKRDIDQYQEKEFLYEIIDEAQYIKNQTTAAAKAVKLIRSKSRFALTGTPIENRLSELWSIFDYLMPGFLYSYDAFKKDFETPIVKRGDEDKMKRLQKMVGPFILRRLKHDVLKDLPEKLQETRTVRLERQQRKP